MRMIDVQDDGTTTVELTDREAHPLRDILANAAVSGDSPAWTLSRLLAHAHGDEG